MKNNLRQYLRQYLTQKGHKIDQSGVMRCPHPNHTDKNPSAKFYENTQQVFCNVCDCGKGWDIYTIAGFEVGQDFKDQKKHLEEFFGVNQNLPANNEPVNLPFAKAQKVYTPDAFDNMLKYIQGGKYKDYKFTKAWPYKDDTGENVVGVDARFELKGKKATIPFWFNGESVKAKNPPVMIYGLEGLKSNKPILVVEGAKSVEAARALDTFTPISWSGGGKKYQKADWSPLKGKEVYIYPDDDTPGIETALGLRDVLVKIGCKVRVVEPIKSARKLKPKGADIVEALEAEKPHHVTRWILEGGTINDKKPEVQTPKEVARPKTGEPETKNQPFRAFGTGDDGRAYFRSGRDGRILAYDLSSMTSTKILTLINITKVTRDYPGIKTRIDWQDAISDIIEQSIGDFDINQLRGRGAWKEDDGKICYHDGKKTYGEYDPTKIFMSKVAKPIGIGSEYTDIGIRKQIFNTVVKLPFESMADCARILAWSVLSPFCGALYWRCAGILTGGTSTGKSFLQDNVIKPLADCRDTTFSGETTPAGIMQFIKSDACPVIIEESEDETEKQRLNRGGLFSLMRQSTSDTTPKVHKGTSDQKGVSYDLKCMFLYCGISANVESVADENRVFKARLKKNRKLKWGEITKEIKTLVTKENCQGIRSFTWEHLSHIMAAAEELTPWIIEITQKDHRWARAEALLFSAYLIVWQGAINFKPVEVKERIRKFYDISPPSETRDESEDLVSKIFDHQIKIRWGKGINREDDEITVFEGLKRMKTGRKEFVNNEGLDSDKDVDKAELMEIKNTFARSGIVLAPMGKGEEKELAIRLKCPRMGKILGLGLQYHERLSRHDNYRITKGVSMLGTSHNCVVIGGVLNFNEG